MMTSQFLNNQFLVALPDMLGTYFANTLTYICRHDEHGAFGIVVNRPSPITLKEILEYADLKADIDPYMNVMEGGPVMQSRPLILHSADVDTAESLDLGHGLALTADVNGGRVFDLFEAISEGRGPEKYMVALGYAGWGPGQLENELSVSTWLTCTADRTVLFDEPYEKRIQRATSALGFDFRMMASGCGEA